MFVNVAVRYRDDMRKTTDIQEFRAITRQIIHTLPLAEELQPTW